MTAIDDSAAFPPERPQPIAEQGGRIASLDFIRGIAVMGILAANIFSMGQPFSAYMYPDAFTTGHSRAEDWMWAAQLVLIDGKMRGLFTILFGAGVYLFMEKAWAKGASRWLQVKRLLWLALFGLIHFYFIWRGDILFSYAVSGLVAVLLFINLSARQQIVLGTLGYIAGGIFYAVSMIFMQVTVDGPEPDSAALSQVRGEFIASADRSLADGEAETAIRQSGTYPEFVAHTFEKHGLEPLVNAWLVVFETLPLMLIGMGLYRFGLFCGAWDARSQRIWGWAGLAVGGILTLLIALMALDGGLTYYGVMAAALGWSHFPRLFMTLGLVALLAHYAPPIGHWFGDKVSAAGRAAFTNYMGTSLVMLFVFGNWGFDLFGRLGRGELYLVVLAAWITMLAWSQAWLIRYRYGPLEWLWRCLTYGKMFALRR